MPGSVIYTIEELLHLRGVSSRRVDECMARLSRQYSDLNVIRPHTSDVLRSINIGSSTNPSSRRSGRGRNENSAANILKDRLPTEYRSEAPPPAQKGPGIHPPRAKRNSQMPAGESPPKATATIATDRPSEDMDGFKKFYKAVVSPSHVRVTAGGRIVPNNRAPGSPTPKAAPRSSQPATGEAADRSSSPTFTPGPALPRGRQGRKGYATMPNPPSQMVQQLPTQLGFLPTDHGWLQIPIAFAPPPGYAVLRAPSGGDDPTTGNAFPAGVGFEEDCLAGAGLCAPPPTSAGPVAGHRACAQRSSAVGQPGYLISQIGGSMPSRCTVSPGSGSRGGGYHPSMGMGTALSSALNLTMSTPVQAPVPPASSIKASEITKCHIERMREVIRYNEDQVNLNRHQVDERALRQQNDQVRKLIETFEKTLDSQVEVEEGFSFRGTGGPPAVAETYDGEETGEYRARRAPDMQSRVPTAGPDESGGGDNSRVPTDIGLAGYRHHGRGPDLRSSVTLTADFPKDDCHMEHLGMPLPSADPVKAPEWTVFPPSHDVAAPPFQLRNKLAHPAEEGHAFPGRGAVGEDRYRGDLRALTRLDKHARARAEGGNGRGMSPPDAGSPNEGIRLSPGRDALTEEERESRHLYWGKASRTARKGLPKFDGKGVCPPPPPRERELAGRAAVAAAKPRAEGPSASNQDGSSEADPFGGLGGQGKGEFLRLAGSPSRPTPPGHDDVANCSSRPGSEFLRNIMKKSPAGGIPLPRAGSSTTAQGVLPQLTCHAAPTLNLTAAHSWVPQKETRPGSANVDFGDVEERLRELTFQDTRKTAANARPL